MPASGPPPTPFFHDPATHRRVDDISNLKDVVLYVGAGASIERTGLTWEGLTAQLLDTTLGTFADRVNLVRSLGPLSASSVVSEQYRQAHGDRWRDRLTEAISTQLYRGSDKSQSYFNERVVALANDYLAAGKQAVIVTPNYDSFLLDAAESTVDPQWTSVKTFVFGVPADDATARLLDESIESLSEELGGQTTLCVIHLHGLITRHKPDSGGLVTHPVVSEADYADTRERSRRILALLFEKRDAVIVGSSVTDPPLIHALLLTNPPLTPSGRESRDAPRRFTIQSTQGRAATDTSKSAAEMERLRAKHLGLTLVAPDYYFQAPQLLEEVRIDLGLEFKGKNYSDPGSRKRYGQRLGAWWESWFADVSPDIVGQQREAHELLRKSVERVRDIIEAPDEELRLEAWIRWRPEERSLMLWASSVGTWSDTSTARRDPIRADSGYAATRSFVYGAPLYTESRSANERWRSFVAKPFRLTDQAVHVNLPLGVVCLSSMTPQEDSALNPKNQHYAAALMAYLDGVGAEIFVPTSQRDAAETVAAD